MPIRPGPRPRPRPRPQVPERQLLCVWTQDSHEAGKSVILPYAAVSDIDIEVRFLCVQ